MRLTKVLWPIIIICSALAALIAMLVFPGTVVRPPLIMLFLFICPGMALVRFLHLTALVDKLALALALSFSIDGIVAGIYLYTDHWSPASILMTLAIISIVAVIVETAHVHIFIYSHVGLVRYLGALLTHPLIIGTSSSAPPYMIDLVDVPTARVMSVPSTSNLPGDNAPESIEEKVTLPMANVMTTSSSREGLEQPVPSTSENIEEKATMQLVNVVPSSLAREGFEHQTTAQMFSARKPLQFQPRFKVHTHIPGPHFPKATQPSDDTESHVDRPSDDTESHVDIEAKDILNVTSVPIMPQVVNEDDDGVVRVSGPQSMQRQLSSTNDSFPDEDIEARPKPHIANVPAPVSAQTAMDVPELQSSPSDNLRTASQQLFNKEEERSNSFTRNRTLSKKRFVTRITRFEE